MQILYVLERIRTPWLDALMLALTELGGETAFLVAALIVFWCVDKRKAYYMIGVGFIGTVANQIMKIAFRIPRPWVRDPSFSIVEAAREGASGYSFPSGHSQTAVGTFGSVAVFSKKNRIRYACITIAVIVPITRMYLGVHTPADVIIGSAMAIALLFLLEPVFFGNKERYIPALFLAMLVLAFAFVAYSELFPFPADTDAHNLESARSNAYTLLGTIAGMNAVYFYDEKKLHFPTEAKWYAQVGKVIGGLAVVLLIKEGLTPVLETILGGHLIVRSISYMLIVLAAGMVWPMSFQWFSKLGRKDIQ